MGERGVRNAEVRGSIPLRSTRFPRNSSSLLTLVVPGIGEFSRGPVSRSKAGFLDLEQLLHYLVTMPVVQKFSASRVVMYAADHAPAHVHVQLRDGRECTVDLENLSITGRIFRREIREELLWIESNRPWLNEEWRRLNP